MKKCSTFQDPNARDECDVRSLSAGISKLRGVYDTSIKRGDQETAAKAQAQMKQLQAQQSKIEEALAFRRNQAGIQQEEYKMENREVIEQTLDFSTCSFIPTLV